MDILVAYMGVNSLMEGVKVTKMLDRFKANSSSIKSSQPQELAVNPELLTCLPFFMECQESSLIDKYHTMFPYQAQQEAMAKTSKFYAEEEKEFKELCSRFLTQKQEIFKKHHYQFTAQGEPVTSENGDPILFPNTKEECEPEKAKELRLAWEERQCEKIDNKYSAEKKKLISKTVAELRSTTTSHLSELGNRDVQNKMQELVAKGEQELRNLEFNKQLDIMKAGFPTIEIKKQLEEAAGKLKEKEKEFFEELGKSQAGQELLEYQKEVLTFLLEKKEQFVQNHDLTYIASSPGNLAYLVPSSSNGALANSIQEMLQSISSKYKPFLV